MGKNYNMGKPLPGRQGMNKAQQREWEEAMELDRMLEQERRQQSI